MDSAATFQCPAQGCTKTIDLKLKSSDGVTFGAHRDNLAVFGDGFPPLHGTNVPDEIVPMVESGEVLSLMLQFMHHQRQPDCGKIRFEVMIEFAAAVEKWGIYSATEGVRAYLKSNLLNHSLPILVYAIKHEQWELAELAGPHTVNTRSADPNLMEVLNTCTAAGRPDIFVAWVKYQEAWRDRPSFQSNAVIKEAFSDKNLDHGDEHGQFDCVGWSRLCQNVHAQVASESQTSQRPVSSSLLDAVLKANTHIALNCPDRPSYETQSSWSENVYHACEYIQNEILTKLVPEPSIRMYVEQA